MILDPADLLALKAKGLSDAAIALRLGTTMHRIRHIRRALGVVGLARERNRDPTPARKAIRRLATDTGSEAARYRGQSYQDITRAEARRLREGTAC